MSADRTREITYRIRRFDPEKDSRPHWEDYRIPCTEGMTVLEGLWTIKEIHDASLAWRASCRMGICGSCGMLINGRPRLGCNTQISELGSDLVEVAPPYDFTDITSILAAQLLMNAIGFTFNERG